MMILWKKWIVTLFVCFMVFPTTGVFSQTSKDFIPLLVDVEGWKGDEPKAIDVPQQGLKGINVSRKYSMNGKKFEAGILAGQQAIGFWNPAYQEGFKMDTGDIWMEVKKEDGFLVIQNFQRSQKSGTFVVLLQEIEPGKGTGAVFAVMYEGIENNQGMEIAKKFDWAKMSKLMK